VTLRIGIPVPDTAASGLNTVELRAWLAGFPFVSDSCDHSFHDPGTPVQLSLVESQAFPDRVRLVWWAPGAPGAAAVVSRREPPAPWQALASLVADGQGYFVYEDRTVRPGAGYAYRLAVSDGAGQTLSEEAWLDVPRALRLAFEAVRPNPADRGVAISLFLPSAAPAALEMLDISGRRRLVRDVSGLGPGSHMLELGDTARLPSGVYLLRLRQGGRSALARVCVVH
jgi:hypothetical protein